MRNQLGRDVVFFLDDDGAFIQWCYDNPDGVFWNCFRKKEGAVVRPYMLHGATRKGKLCQHFRDSTRASGFTDNLTTTDYCKVCCTDRQAAEKWARKYSDTLLYCSSCIRLPAQ